LLFSAALGAGAALVPTVASAATNTVVNAKINGDDQFKVHLSTLSTESGFQYVNGYGWSVTYPGKVLLPTDTAQLLVPAGLGINGSGPSPWGVIPTNNLSAEWISAPPSAPPLSNDYKATWFQTHITCNP
jgi:hypothetical protein